MSMNIAATPVTTEPDDNNLLDKTNSHNLTDPSKDNESKATADFDKPLQDVYEKPKDSCSGCLKIGDKENAALPPSANEAGSSGEPDASRGCWKIEDKENAAPPPRASEAGSSDEPGVARAVTADAENVSAPEDELMIRLRKAVGQTVSKISTGSESRFLEVTKVYKKFFEADRKAVRTQFQKFCTGLQQQLTDEIDVLFEDEKIPSVLARLSELKRDAPAGGKRAWRPTRNPQKDVGAHVAKVLKGHVENLEERARQLQAEQDELLPAVKKARAETEQLAVRQQAAQHAVHKILSSDEACVPDLKTSL